MYLIDRISGVHIPVEIKVASKVDIANIKKPRYSFDWAKAINNGAEVYKLLRENETTILGLLWITNHTDPHIDAIEINLLEVAIENVGSKKQLERIGGNLIAFACRESLKRDHDGYAFLTPKTKLIEHYQNNYGMTHIASGRSPTGLMTMNNTTALKLVETYLK